MNKILQLFKRPDLRKKILYILALLVVYRLVSNIPIPGVDPERLREFFSQNAFFGLISTFTGGALANVSIGMLGLGPYITGSIIMQLLTMIFPSLEQMYKYEGEAGRMKFNQYSRMLTVPLAAVQGYGFLAILSRQGVVGPFSMFEWVTAISSVIAASMFFMWLGELITEKNMGNGVSLLILAGIVAGFPQSIRQFIFEKDLSFVGGLKPDHFTALGFILVSLAVVVGVVYISEAQRNIPVNYARRVRGSKLYGGVSTYLPMRVNNAGVIPIIFALSILLFPGVIANFFADSSIQIVATVSRAVSGFVQNPFWYSVLYFAFVVLFTYFYTAITFDPKSIAENIQKQGGYIPGIRPGPTTAQFLGHLLNRITLAGALFLGTIAILPNIVQGATGINAFTIGGTSILIVVSVAIEIMKQSEAQLAMYEY